MPMWRIDRWVYLAPLVYLLLGLSCGSAIATGSEPNLPVRLLVVNIEKGTLQEFLEQIRVSAEANRFAIWAKQTSPDPEHILIQMWRQDIRGIGVNTSQSAVDEITYTIFFYRNSSDFVPDSAFDEVITQFHSSLSGTQGVLSVTEKEP